MAGTVQGPRDRLLRSQKTWEKSGLGRGCMCAKTPGQAGLGEPGGGVGKPQRMSRFKSRSLQVPQFPPLENRDANMEHPQGCSRRGGPLHLVRAVCGARCGARSRKTPRPDSGREGNWVICTLQAMVKNLAFTLRRSCEPNGTHEVLPHPAPAPLPAPTQRLPARAAGHHTPKPMSRPASSPQH